MLRDAVSRSMVPRDRECSVLVLTTYTIFKQYISNNEISKINKKKIDNKKIQNLRVNTYCADLSLRDSFV